MWTTFGGETASGRSEGGEEKDGLSYPVLLTMKASRGRGPRSWATENRKEYCWMLGVAALARTSREVETLQTSSAGSGTGSKRSCRAFVVRQRLRHRMCRR